MAGDDDPVGGSIKTAVSLMMRRVAKEDAQGGARRKLVCGSGGEVGITCTTKNTKVIVGREFTVKGELR
jgi:hypothetical protein